MNNNRYNRQIDLININKQHKLKNSHVLIAGIGGLGSVITTYLASVGVGNITLLDYDVVDITNLNRQFLHNEQDIGKKKVLSGLEKISKFNSTININTIDLKIENDNLIDMINKDTIIVDALDNNKARYYLSKIAYDLKLPLFHAAVSGFFGQVSTFIPSNDNPCLFCFLSKSSIKKETESKRKIPIIGSTVGVVGSIECNEVIKYITEKGNLLIGKMLLWNGLNNSIEYIQFKKNNNCSICGNK